MFMQKIKLPINAKLCFPNSAYLGLSKLIQNQFISDAFKYLGAGLIFITFSFYLYKLLNKQKEKRVCPKVYPQNRQ